MLSIEFAKLADTITTPPRKWSGEFWYSTMSIDIPENVDVMVIRCAARAGTNPSAITIGHITTGSFMRLIDRVSDGNVHNTSVFETLLPPTGPTTLYIRSSTEINDRILVDYLRNVNIKSATSASVRNAFTATSSLVRNTNPGDLVLDVINKSGGMTASITQTVQLYSQDSSTTTMWYGASYTFATGSTTTMTWTSPSSTNSHLAVVYTPSPGGRVDVTQQGQNQINVSNIPEQGSLMVVR